MNIYSPHLSQFYSRTDICLSVSSSDLEQISWKRSGLLHLPNSHELFLMLALFPSSNVSFKDEQVMECLLASRIRDVDVSLLLPSLPGKIRPHILFSVISLPPPLKVESRTLLAASSISTIFDLDVSSCFSSSFRKFWI